MASSTTSGQLARPVASITMTKRRRFLWAVWMSGPPTRVPFKKPDFSDGGEPTFDDALRAAEAKVGASVAVIDPLWARAWIRILRGEPAWPSKASREPHASPSAPATNREPESIWALLGVAGQDVTESDLKAAYRKRALETHPDHGGDEPTFRRVVAAYEEAKKRLRRPKPKKKEARG